MEMNLKQHKITLRGLITLTLLGVILLCILLVVGSSYRSMREIETRRLRPAVITNAVQIRDELEQGYLSLIHLSEQLSPLGYVGKNMNSYLSAQNQYSRITSYKQLGEDISSLSFFYPKLLLSAYLKESISFYSSMGFKEDFSILALPVLSSAVDIDYHAMHMAGCRFSNEWSISVSRRVSLLDGDYVIYLEGRTAARSLLQDIQNSQSRGYAMLQLDTQGRIQYSTLPALFPVGEAFPGKINLGANSLGRTQGYVYAVAGSTFGIDTVLLLPETDYDKEAKEFQTTLLLSLGLVLILTVFITLVLHQQFYRPLVQLRKEMNRFGRGDIRKAVFHSRIREYDDLFLQFEEMKTQITRLMRDVHRQEAEKRRLELDKLSYQVNPHFLMNALNSAQWQATMENQTELASYLSKLNYLLGYTLGKVSLRTTLRTEITLLQDYLALQQTRQDFQVHMDIAPGLYLDRSCARLLLQPIAENAICHSINEFGNLQVEMRPLANQSVEIYIRDDGPGFDTQLLRFQEMPAAGEERQKDNGIGLRYVYLTLQEFYHGKAIMTVTSQTGKGTCVHLILPPPADAQK